MEPVGRRIKVEEQVEVGAVPGLLLFGRSSVVGSRFVAAARRSIETVGDKFRLDSSYRGIVPVLCVAAGGAYAVSTSVGCGSGFVVKRMRSRAATRAHADVIASQALKCTRERVDWDQPGPGTST